MPTARIGENSLYFERSGTGPRLLFLNGSGTTLSTSSALLKVWGQSFDILAFDQRGIGQSELPAASYSMADLAHDAVALADQFEWDSFNLMGVSFGGMVAQEVAVTVPDRIDRLALLCTSAGGGGGSSYPLHTLTTMGAEAFRIRTKIIDSRFTPAWLDEHSTDRMIVNTLEQRTRVPQSDHGAMGEALQMQARSNHNTFSRLSAIRCPTFVASGRFDGIAPPANGAAIAAQIPGAEFHVYEGGHVFFMQDATAFPEIVGFLTRQA